MYLISKAPELWKFLNGVVCVYKPSGLSVESVRRILLGNIARDLNAFPCRPPEQRVITKVKPNGETYERWGPSFADSELVVGPRYLPKDIRCRSASFVGRLTSGILVFGINNGTLKAKQLHESRPVRVYKVSGKLGIATDTFDVNGAVVERSTFRHVSSSILDRVLASMQAAHQKKTYEHMGIDMKSQEAYEIAVRGLIRPASGKIPFFYSIKCVDFRPPSFTIEIKCINENEMFLKTLVHDIGVEVHATAACTGIRRIRYGPFHLDHALLRRHWNLEAIFSNLSLCHKILNENNILLNDTPGSLMLDQSSHKSLSAS